MKKNTGKQPKYWVILLLIAQSIYLIFELTFNARLVDSITVSDMDYFDYLSFVGRCISGVGFTLLIYSGVRCLPNCSWKKTATKLFGIAIIAFPIMFFGQERIVDYFVDKSTSTQRMHAQYLILLKQGLVNNAVVVKGVEYEAEDIEKPSVKTFISNLGFMVFFTPNYIQSVIHNSDQILEHIAEKRASRDLDRFYSSYLVTRQKIAQIIKQYNGVNAAYVKQANRVPQQAEQIWLEIITELQQQWDKIEAQGQQESIVDSLDALVDGMELYHLGQQKCKRMLSAEKAICLNKVEELYQREMQAKFGQNVAADYWCKRVSGKKKQVMVGSNFVEKKLKDILLCNHKDRSFLCEKMFEITGKDGGCFQSWEAFFSSKFVADNVRNKLKVEGLNMPEKYRMGSHESFIHGVSSDLKRLLKKSFEKKTEEQFGQPIIPLLSQKEFLEHSLIQKSLKKAIGFPETSRPISFDLSEMQFRDQILIPVIRSELEKKRSHLAAGVDYFADGALGEKIGKQYVRSILIPPIAMGISMFFALLNLSTVSAGIWLLFGGSKGIMKIGRIGFIVIILVLPMAFPRDIAKSSTFQEIVNETSTQLGSGRYFIVWLSNLQPIIYPIGIVIADTLNLFSPRVEEMQ